MTTPKVLVVDDDRAINKLVQTQLDMLGLQAATCTSITRAKQLVHAEAFKFVLSDINMPGGSGIELAQWLQDAHPSLPLYLMTGHCHELPKAVLERYNVLDVLRKPFQFDDLLTMITPQLDQGLASMGSPANHFGATALQL